MANNFFDFTRQGTKTFKVKLEGMTVLCLPPTLKMFDAVQNAEKKKDIQALKQILLIALNHNIERKKVDEKMIEDFDMNSIKAFIKSYMNYFNKEVANSPN